MSIKKLIVLLFLALTPWLLLAQMRKGWSISTLLHTGYVTRHTTKLTIDNSGISEGFGINFQFQTYGKADWHAHRKFPQAGLEIAAFRLNNHEQLGNAFGFLPNITLPITHKKNWNLRTTIGMGVAWLSKHYDPLSNTLNNAIGSHINNYTSVRLFAEKTWSEQWKWSAGASFTHFSNGASKLPNYGLNVPALILGLNYAPHSVKPEDYTYPAEPPTYQKWGFFAEASAARQEFIAFNGPKYPNYNLALAATYNENSDNRTSLGIEYEYNFAVFNFYKFLEQYDEATTKNTGKRYIVFAGHEFLFGQIGLGAQFGVYVGPYKYLLPRSFYNKLNAKYYFTPFGKKGIQPFLALHMKAHLIDAEYISVGIGVKR